ncbi:DNA repair and recombination protein RadA [Labeo rohita]|uniref:DNA repair and recombination protein RadA n=1 Tax=Labeo rohita TaxID=84645 RepID=A0ABQ8L456_LABRO|nr:DNA repair and recombination protein RadA [Labeo rohita]
MADEGPRNPAATPMPQPAHVMSAAPRPANVTQAKPVSANAKMAATPES